MVKETIVPAVEKDLAQLSFFAEETAIAVHEKKTPSKRKESIRGFKRTGYSRNDTN